MRRTTRVRSVPVDGMWLQMRIADEWSEVRRLERVGQPVRAAVHRAAVDRLLDRFALEHRADCTCG